MLPQVYREVDLLIPYSKQSLSSYFMSQYDVDSVVYEADGTRMSLSINDIDFEKYKEYIIKNGG